MDFSVFSVISVVNLADPGAERRIESHGRSGLMRIDGVDQFV